MKSLLLGSASLIAVLVSGQGALAQAIPDPDSAVAPQEQTRELQEVVVTAQRRSENLQRAAVAVDVVTAETLAAAGVNSPQALNQIVPSLTVQSGGGANTSFFVRGVGNFTQNAYSDPAISFNLDGVYIGRPTSTTGTFFDLERIEVLKGPQGTLYGRNATAGAINVIPNRPQLGELEGAASLGYGSYDAIDIQGAFNAPIGETSAIRIAGAIADRTGYNDDGTWDEESKAVRAQFLTEPNDDLSLRVSADYARQGGTGSAPTIQGFQRFRPGAPATAQSQANYVYVPTNLPPESGLFTPEALAIFTRATIGGAFINPRAPAYPEQDNVYYGVNAEVGLDTGFGTLTVVPAYREAKLDNLFNGPAFQGAQIDETDEQFSTEVRFEGERIGIFDYLVGAYYFDEQIQGQAAYNQYVITSYQEYESRTRSYAGFGRIVAHLTDAFRLVAGGRYTEDQKEFNGIARTLVQACRNAPPPAGPGCFGGPSQPLAQTFAELGRQITLPRAPGPANAVPFGTSGNILFFTPTVINADPTFDKFTYRLAAEWDVAPRSLLYASFETGFRSGGFSLASGRETFQPETIEAFTVGSKNRLFDNRLQINAEAFYWTYQDQQISHFGADGAGNNSFFTENAGSSTIKGAEVEAQYLLTENTRLNGTVQYIDSMFDDFKYRTLFSAIPPVTGCAFSAVNDRNLNAAPGNDPEFLIDCSGKVGYNSPKWSVNAGVEHTIPLGTMQLVVEADTRYRSSRVAGFDYTPQQLVESDFISNAAATLSPQDGPWALRVYVRNIEDTRTPTFVQYNSTSDGAIVSNFTAPRTFGAIVSVSF